MWVKFKVSFQTDADDNKLFIFPDDRNLFTDLIDLDGEYFAAKYSGNKDLTPYASPILPIAVKSRIVSHIAFRMMLPPLLRGVVSHPALAATLPNIGNDPVKIAKIAVFADCIRDARAPLPDGGFGVDLDDPLTKMGLMQAVEFGLITQVEMDEILK